MNTHIGTIGGTRSVVPPEFTGIITPKLREQFELGLFAGRTLRSDLTLDRQPVENYTAGDHEMWQTLYRRQAKMLRGRACDEFFDGLQTLKLGEDRVPNFEALNETLMKATGWQIVTVPGLLPNDLFFHHLANRQFPASWWIRKPEEMDYLEEPDIFHDMFGHVPLLINPVFADYMEAYGKGGLKAEEAGMTMQFGRLYWYSVEFGLIRTSKGMRIYGAGILSSKGESEYCLDSASPNRIGFDIRRVMRTSRRIDMYQKTYFVIDDFKALFDMTQQDFGPVYDDVRELSTVRSTDVLNTDNVITRGTGKGWTELLDMEGI